MAIFIIVEKEYRNRPSIVFDICLKALEQLRMHVDYKNRQEGIIEASTGASIWSWGEKIIIEIIPRNNGSLVRVNSEATAQLFSWGKDSSNERQIIEEMTKTLRN